MPKSVKASSYHVYEKLANSDLFAKFEEYLVFAYLNLGNMKKAGEVSRPWATRTGGTLFYFLNQLAFNCLYIRNLNNYAMISFFLAYRLQTPRPEVPIVRKEDQQVVVFNLKLTLKHFCTLDGGFFLNCIKRQNNHEKIRETLLTFMNYFHFDEIFYSKFKIPKDTI